MQCSNEEMGHKIKIFSFLYLSGERLLNAAENSFYGERLDVVVSRVHFKSAECSFKKFKSIPNFIYVMPSR